MKKLIALFLLLVAPAQADIVTVTVTGVVDGDYRFTPTSGFDTSGIFAPAGSSLIGDPFTVQWVVDTDGNNGYNPTAVLSATLTINSRTVQYDPTFYSYMFVATFRRDLNVTKLSGAVQCPRHLQFSGWRQQNLSLPCGGRVLLGPHHGLFRYRNDDTGESQLYRPGLCGPRPDRWCWPSRLAARRARPVRLAPAENRG